MQQVPVIVAATILLAWSPGMCRADNDQTKRTHAAITKSLTLIEKSTAVYRDNRTCFSCHHQTMPTVTLAEAKAHGFKIDEANFQAQLKRTHNHLRRNRAGYLEGRGQGGQVDTAGFALWALQRGEWKADDVTAAVVEYLLLRDRKQDHWRGTRGRPPTQASDIARTAVILQALDAYGTKEQQNRVAERRKKALAWLAKVKTRDTEDRVFQLRALAYLKAGKKQTDQVRSALLAKQNADGGWSQRPGMNSDAYATGTVLVTLHKAGGVPVTDKAYQRGIEFLLKAQKEDGSWHVVSRSRPFQRYFESGFPHGKDQFISISASCWATSALILAAPNTVENALNDKTKK